MAITGLAVSHSEKISLSPVKAAHLDLLREMAKCLEIEVKRALLPPSPLDKSLDDDPFPEFREQVTFALANGVERVSRLTRNMYFLACESSNAKEVISLDSLMEEAFQEVTRHHPNAQFKYRNDTASLALLGDRSALKHAIAEIACASLEHRTDVSTVWVDCRTGAKIRKPGNVEIGVQAANVGYDFEIRRSVPLDLLRRRRNLALDFGRHAARKIFEDHGGTILSGAATGIIISLPLASEK